MGSAFVEQGVVIQFVVAWVAPMDRLRLLVLICRLVGVQLAQGASAVSQMFGFPFTVIMTGTLVLVMTSKKRGGGMVYQGCPFPSSLVRLPPCAVRLNV